MEEIGIYIHIPFCKQKCYYCDFISFPCKENFEKKYIDALKKEIKNCKLDAKKISTIYIGGGTPSYIDSAYIKEIIDIIKEKWGTLGSSVEATIEVNPGTVTQEKLQEYKNIGINRLSIGLQSTNDKILKQIGRIHTYNQFLETFQMARNVGFENINVDLMLALPNQTIYDLKESLKNVINLKPEHISVYSLILEENTKMYDMVQSGKLNLPDDDTERNMYWYVKDTLELEGYTHYEISNFAKANRESKHNVDCWNQKEYIGFGLSAHSYIKKQRFSNTTNLEQYICNIELNQFEKNRIIEEVQNEQDMEKEFMLLGLRKIEGVSIQNFKNKFGENPIYIFMDKLKKLVDENLLDIDGDNIKLTNRGLDLANLVWEEFV
jgi:oxygen-independent coproporphyrinogen-3 oxidase